MNRNIVYSNTDLKDWQGVAIYIHIQKEKQLYNLSIKGSNL